MKIILFALASWGVVVLVGMWINWLIRDHQWASPEERKRLRREHWGPWPSARIPGSRRKPSYLKKPYYKRDK